MDAVTKEELRAKFLRDIKHDHKFRGQLKQLIELADIEYANSNMGKMEKLLSEARRLTGNTEEDGN